MCASRAVFAVTHSQERQRVVRFMASRPNMGCACNASVPEWIRGEHLSLAVRVSAHPPVQALCRLLVAPLFLPVPILAGQPTAQNAEQIVQIFANQVDYIVDAPLGGQSKPFTNPRCPYRRGVTSFLIRECYVSVPP
jgi:hypothetical protein